MTDTLPPRLNLSIPEDWAVQTHELRRVHPQNLDNGDLDWELLSEDLFQVKHEAIGLLLDVGWYPDASSSGHFKLVLIQDQNWEFPLLIYRTNSLDEILSKIETTLTNTNFLKELSSNRRKNEPILANLLPIIDESSDINDAVAAVKSLSENHGEDAISLLIERISDSRARVRYAVVDALKQIGHPSAGEILYNRFLLPEPDLDTRRLLIRALGAVGYAPAIPTLISWLQNPDSQQRAAAAWSLGILKAKKALSSITSAYATERNRSARNEMKTALYRISHTG